MRVLITGSRGHVGTKVTEAVLAKGHEVVEADHKISPEFDLSNVNNIRRVMNGVDTVIHLAGIPHPWNEPFSKFFEANILMTHRMLWIANECNVKRFIYSSSSAYYGGDAKIKPMYLPIDEEHPSNFDLSGKIDESAEYHYHYPTSKKIAEALIVDYAKHTPLECVILRMGPAHEKHNYFKFENQQEDKHWIRKSLFAWTPPSLLGKAFTNACDCSIENEVEIFNIMGTKFPEGYKIKGMEPLDWFIETYGKLPGATKKNFSDGQTFYDSSKAVEVLGWEG